MEISGPLGLIAGKGILPKIVCDTAKQRGVPVVAAAFEKETAASLEKSAKTKIFGVGQAGKVIKFFKAEGVKNVCMIGKIEKSLIFKNPKFDLRVIKAMRKMLNKNDTSLMLAIIDELEEDGMKVVRQTDWLPALLPKKGILGNKKPAKEVTADFQFGIKICHNLAGKDIGQSVIVKNGVVLSVEAVEGTDAAIERGCSLGGKGIVMVKTSRPKQDLRYDIPAVGPGTIKILSKYKAAGLAVEANRTIVVDMEKTISMCNKAGIVFAAL